MTRYLGSARGVLFALTMLLASLAPRAAWAQSVSFIEMARYETATEYFQNPNVGGGIEIPDGGTAFDTDHSVVHRTRVYNPSYDDEYLWYFHRPDRSIAFTANETYIWNGSQSCWEGWLNICYDATGPGSFNFSFGAGVFGGQLGEWSVDTYRNGELVMTQTFHLEGALGGGTGTGTGSPPEPCTNATLTFVPGDQVSGEPGTDVGVALQVDADPAPGESCIVSYTITSEGTALLHPAADTNWQGVLEIPAGGGAAIVMVALPDEFTTSGVLMGTGTLESPSGPVPANPDSVDVIPPSCFCRFGDVEGEALVLGSSTSEIDLQLTNLSQYDTCEFDLTFSNDRGTPTAATLTPARGRAQPVADDQVYRTSRIRPDETTSLGTISFRTTENTLTDDFLAVGTLRAEAVDGIGGCVLPVRHCVVPDYESTDPWSGPFGGFADSSSIPYATTARFDARLEPEANWDAAGPSNVVKDELVDLALTGSCGLISDPSLSACTDVGESAELRGASHLVSAPYDNLVGLGTLAAEQVFRNLAWTAGDSSNASQSAACTCRARKDLWFRCGLDSRSADPWVHYQTDQLQKWAGVSEPRDPAQRTSLLDDRLVSCGEDGRCEGDPGYPGPDLHEQIQSTDVFPYQFLDWPEFE